MRKEIFGIILLALVVFSFGALFTYHPGDPSIHATSGPSIQNVFGYAGAQYAGFIVGLFGAGAFWVPVLFLHFIWLIYKDIEPRRIWLAAGGGALLIITTGALFALRGPTVEWFGARYSSGGLIGIPLAVMGTRMVNRGGACFFYLLIWLIGWLLVTRISLVELAVQIHRLTRMLLARLRQIAPERRLRQLVHVRAVKKTLPPPASASSARKKTPQIAAPKPPRTAENPSEETEKNRPPRAVEAPAPPPEKNKPLQAMEQQSVKTEKTAPERIEPARIEPARIEIVRPRPKAPPVAPERVLMRSDSDSSFELPSIEFLDEPGERPDTVDAAYLEKQSELLEKKLEDFGVRGEVKKVIPGPVITTFEYAPAPGIKINRIVNLSDDLALALRAISIRIVAPIPGRAVIGIEIPNKTREIVRFKEMVTSAQFARSRSPLTLCLGKDIIGDPVMAALEKMPHLLIAGATGTGKSVGLNAMICSILYKARPEEVKFIMVDPKRIELSLYDGIPHLITPVVTDVKKATNALFWAVKEMEQRYELLAEHKVRNIGQFNEKVADGRITPDENGELPAQLPFIVIVIDELADLMMVASRDVEVALMRLAQMARAAGLHLILATQRPSVDVLTGIIKANFPTRLTFQVSSRTDSRTIIDTGGAETLLGKGDMLFLPPGTARLQRVHGAYLSEPELEKIIEFLKEQKAPEYVESITEAQQAGGGKDGETEYDERYDDAVALVTKTRQASISMVQRHLRIGYNRAARIIETMESEGVVGPADGAKPREVLVAGYDDEAE